MVNRYKEQIETKNAFVKKFALDVYAAFDESYTMWLSAVQSIAELDALMGLAKGSMNMGGRHISLDSSTRILTNSLQSLPVDLFYWIKRRVLLNLRNYDILVLYQGKYSSV